MKLLKSDFFSGIYLFFGNEIWEGRRRRWEREERGEESLLLKVGFLIY